MRTHRDRFNGLDPHPKPAGITEVRARLTGLQLHPRLAPLARLEIADADRLVSRAEQAKPDSVEADQLVSEARIKVEQVAELARLRQKAALH